MRPARLITTAAALLVLASSPRAGATPASFHLVFDGRHNAALLHEGTFTASAPLCPSGSAADVSVDATTDTSLRRFTCPNGGDFLAKITPLPAEHGGNGSWQIVDGTGPFAELRGKGTFSSTRLAGRPDDPAAITFRSTWDGVVDFDVVAPTIDVTSATARKLKRPKGWYSVRVALAFVGEADVSYVLQVVDPRKPGNAFVYKVGRTTSGNVTSTSRLKTKHTKTLQIEVTAADAVGNEATAEKTLRLR
jgi:hypothetical protein